MTRLQAEVLTVARRLFRPGVLIGVVSTGDGAEERGHAFCVCEPATGVALAIRGASVQIFKLEPAVIQRMRDSGDLVFSLSLSDSLVS